MDGGRRVSGSLTGPARAGRAVPPDPVRGGSAASSGRGEGASARLRRRFRRHGLGTAASVGFLALSVGYGVAVGGHWPVVASVIAQTPDTLASVLGLRIERITVTGQSALTTAEIVDAVGLDITRSVLFLDAAVAREQLLALPLVESATVRKFYPDRVEIAITERKPFAIWQTQGEFHVISEDGISIDRAQGGRFGGLPLVVGETAETAAAEFLPVLARHPAVQKNTYASVRVGARRWNLRLINGVDVKLPARDAEAALARLEALVSQTDIMKRDLAAIDLRDPDRTLVRLAPAAVAALAKAAGARKPGGST